ncbi:MAG: hypothetical protein IJV65_09790, partial [Kiritimatiellae bacterium]|nr:hypothetical protein [Kiritimatiellia bacterium]
MSAIRNMLLASLAAALVIAPRAASASTTQSRNYVTNAMAAWLAPGHVNDYGAWTFTGESEPTDATENGVTTVSYEFDAGDTLRYAPAAPSPEGLPASVSVTGAVFQAGFVDPDVSVVAGRQAALAVLQREGDDAPAFYAWTGGMEVTDGGATTNLFWTKLAGVSFVAGNAYDVELDFDYAADPATVSFTVGGNALSDAATGTTNAFPLATAENKVNAVGFSGAGSFTGLGGDYDVTFYDVRFYDGAVEYAGYAQTVEAGGLATAPSPDPEKNGFAFAAWTNGLSAVYDFATPVNADLALGAQWTASAVTLTVPAVANATVSATTNGVALAGEAGAGGATVYTVEPGTPVAVTYTAAAGYHVTGSPNDVTTRLYEVSAADTASDYVLDASATTMSLNVYTVTFTWHGGSDAATYDHGTLAADIAVPRDPPDYVEGGNIYSFTGWSAEVPETITADLTFTAQYSATAAAASVFTVTDNGDGTATTNDVAYYATLADAVANAGDGATVLLLDDVTLTARLEPNAGADTAITIDLGGNKITRTGTSGNGSAFDVKSGDVTIRNGTIDCTQDDTAIAEDGVYAITSRSGSNVTLADLAITVDSECGACAYPFSGSTMTIESGTYANVTTTPYRYNTAITGMAVNQPNEATQSLV